ncbi:HD domain-containing protein [Intrasporangium calvum]|uniref:HD domain-containing protein n=1 Tax=Intrasporangium calvum TaxID=53358 RepID=UPI000DF5F819|nr:HD domain-containing protein [Intrasporangium calvum]AXG14962.1 HD domain-containing protein [Intrasporangium calvum]
MVDAELAPAVELARKYLHRLEPRWTHVQAVGHKAEAICRSHGFPIDLAAAAWLHDIGYAPELARTGFHPLDGARFLASIGSSDLVVSLVAHHSGAQFEAEERGLGAELAEIGAPPSDLLDILVLIDMTTGPAGEGMSVDARLSEILARYSADDPVHRAVARSSASLRAGACRAASRLGLAASGP